MEDSIYFDGRHYDALWPGLQRQSELAFYQRRIREFGKPALELGCGTGQLTLALDQQFGLIFFPANALLHLLTWQDFQACLTQVKKHLKSNGAFAFEIFNPSLAMLTRDPSQRYSVGQYADPDGRGTITVTESNVYDAATQINHIRWYYQIGGCLEKMDARLNLRMYYPQEIEALLHYNGFELQFRFGDYDETPLMGTSSRQLIVCTPRQPLG